MIDVNDNQYHESKLVSSKPQRTSVEFKRIMHKLPSKSKLPEVNLDVELFNRHNIAIAILVVLSAMIKGDKQQQELIMVRLHPNYLLGPKLIYSYLFKLIKEELQNNEKIDIASIVENIPNFGPDVYGEPTDKRSLSGHYYNFAIILNLQPTRIHVLKAVDMVEEYAIKNRWSGK